MNPILENLLFRQLDMFAPIISGFVITASALYLLPMIQALYAYSKKRWLERYFAANPSSGDAENKFRQDLLEASEPGQSYPIYKLFKFYFATAGITTIILGFFIVILPEDLGPDAIDWMLYIPAVIGGAIYFLYNAALLGHGLYREIAGVFAFGGFTVTAILAYGNHEMGEWLRADILAFIILGVGGLIVWHSKSIFASYMYMIFVIIAGASVNFFLEDNWMNFLPHLLWGFGIAILYIWLPKLKAAKDVGPKEIIFGILFAAMILSLTMTQLSADSGLLMPALVVVLPGLYVFSKAYFYKSDNIIGKPIEIAVIAIVIFMASTLSTEMGITNASDSIYLFKQYSFEKQFSYFILLGLIGGIFWIFNKDLNDSTEEVNPMIALFPLLAFIISYILGEYGGHYIMTAFLLGLGYLYVRKGIEKKDSMRVALGGIVFVYTFILKFNDILGEELYEEKIGVGSSLILYGAVFLGVIIYIRSQWTVTEPSDTSSTPKISDDSSVIDAPTETEE